MLRSILKRSPLYSILSPMYRKMLRIGDRGYVLMLHRVAERNENGIEENENMKVSPVFLESFICKLKEKYEFIASDKIEEYIHSKKKKKFIVFTLDDGYKDNYTNAFQIFEKHNVPFTIFVASDFPNKKALLWWYGVEELLQNNSKIILGNGKIYYCNTLNEKNDVFREIRTEILKINQVQLQQGLNDMFCNYKIDWCKYCDELCMSWNDITELLNNPLVTIGAHTAHHYNLHELNNEDSVKKEVVEGVEEFKKHINFEPRVFAYPFGSPNEITNREISVLSDMSFKYAFIGTGGGVKQKIEYMAIPREALIEKSDISSLL